MNGFNYSLGEMNNINPTIYVCPDCGYDTYVPTMYCKDCTIQNGLPDGLFPLKWLVVGIDISPYEVNNLRTDWVKNVSKYLNRNT